MINIQSIDDNECFKWKIVRYLHPVDRNPERNTKADNNFAKELDFKDIKCPVKIRDIHKIEKKNSISISILGYENKGKIQFMYQKNVVNIVYKLSVQKKY